MNKIGYSPDISAFFPDGSKKTMSDIINMPLLMQESISLEKNDICNTNLIVQRERQYRKKQKNIKKRPQRKHFKRS